MQKIEQFIRLTGSHYRPFIRTAAMMFALLIVAQLLTLSVPYFEGKIFDKLAEKAPLGEAALYVLFILGVYLVSNFVHYVREQYELRHLDFNLSRFIGETTLERLFRFSLGQHINENSGLRLSVVNKGSQALTQFINSFLYTLVPFVLQIVLATIALLIMSPLLGVIVFVACGSFLYLQYRYNIAFYPRLKKNRDGWNKQSKHFSEMLRNVKLVKLAAKEEATVREYRSHFENVADVSKHLWSDYIGGYYIRNQLVNFGRIAALFVGIYLVTTGVESPGKIVMLIGWMGSVFGNINAVGWLQRQMLMQIADINKYHEMLEREPAVKEPAQPVALPKLGGRIEFRNVFFSYPKLASMDDENGEELGEKDEEASKEILTDVSFVIEPGETVALVGHSGAGKTTIVNLLLRGYDPDIGDVYIDGVNLKELEQKSYLRAVGYVPQIVELFDNTLRYNLAFSVDKPEGVTDEELDSVAKKARIDQFYDRLGEKRFDTLIGENGIKLSGGERQRVGIARSLLKQPEILIFDEATSNLDAENEAVIHEAMREALKGRTGIIIAHRLSTIRDADKIIVMEGGKIAGIGKHDTLIQSCEPYRKLVERQVVSL